MGDFPGNPSPFLLGPIAKSCESKTLPARLSSWAEPQIALKSLPLTFRDAFEVFINALNAHLPFKAEPWIAMKSPPLTCSYHG
ncbi:hypothetical protein Y1Q_0004706 [Alligator mississippiensis]|uniref:Uncharacterized protein n=1 Tax=Alligator mississippiensis TaxID=8496 RepID=A0A151P6C7_ALLMI|nr:hypothetical protein Y1Q_0004706 [Alligator mississippiensis]